MRLAAAVVREFPYWAHRRHDPKLEHEASIVGSLPPARGEVLARSPEAAAEDVRLGMTMMAARALLPDAHFIEPDTLLYKRETDMLIKLLEALSPKVEATGEGVFLLDMRGLGRLHATEEDFARRVQSLLIDAGYPTSVGVAGTRYAATIAALQGDVAVLPPGEEIAFLAPLALSFLPADEQLLESLTLMGITTIGELAELPVEALEARFGRDGGRLHRLACGEDPLPLSPRAASLTPRRALELDGPVENLEAFTFALKRVTDQLMDDLAQRGLAAAELTLTLVLENASLAVRKACSVRPTLSARLAFDLLRVAVLSEPFEAPVTGLVLEATDTAPARTEQLQLFAHRKGDPAAVEGALARLRALLGPEGAVTPRLSDTHRPERQVHWEPYPGLKEEPVLQFQSRSSPVLAPVLKKVHHQAEAPPGPATTHLPARLFEPPRPATVRVAAGRPRFLKAEGVTGSIVDTDGPQRLEGSWWGDRFARDYFQVAMGSTGRYWIFRDRVDGSWYLHGAYD